MRMCLVHGSSDVHRIKVLIAILEEDDASSLKMKNNYRPMLGLYLATSNHSAQCAVCKVYFSAQPNNLKLILNFHKYYPIEHIFVPACSSARKEHFFKF